MVFQKPNPFPKSIYDNIAFGPRVLGHEGQTWTRSSSARCSSGALWDEVKDRLKTNAFGMSGGQQQRLCIARCLAIDPDVILMDEPCSALDPISTGKIEDLMIELKENYSIVIVTHNMQQAARVSDMTAFFTVELDEDEHRTGRVVEFDDTEKIFTNPADERTEDYVTGKVGLERTCRETTRSRTSRTSSSELEEQALGGLDLVGRRARPRARDGHAPGRRAGRMVIADDDRIDGRYLEVHQGILSCWRSRRRWPATCGVVAALLHVINHIERMGDQCVNIAKLVPLAGHEPPTDAEHARRRSSRWATQARSAGRPGQAGFARRDVDLAAGPRAPGRRDRPPQPRGLPAARSRSATTPTAASGRCT